MRPSPYLLAGVVTGAAAGAAAFTGCPAPGGGGIAGPIVEIGSHGPRIASDLAKSARRWSNVRLSITFRTAARFSWSVFADLAASTRVPSFDISEDESPSDATA